jgi:uncharacterized protein YeaO (DUF488 family)
MFVVKRIYDAARQEDGKRYLVDRLWPRGLKKEKARLDGWLKDLAPSTELRTWFHHDPARWEAFRHRYRQELVAPQLLPLLQQLREEAGEETVTLLYAATDREHNHAVCLKDVLEQA